MAQAEEPVLKTQGGARIDIARWLFATPLGRLRGRVNYSKRNGANRSRYRRLNVRRVPRFNINS
jgi:hypothetical protein